MKAQNTVNTGIQIFPWLHVIMSQWAHWVIWVMCPAGMVFLVTPQLWRTSLTTCFSRYSGSCPLDPLGPDGDQRLRHSDPDEGSDVERWRRNRHRFYRPQVQRSLEFMHVKAQSKVILVNLSLSKLHYDQIVWRQQSDFMTSYPTI